ncbi:MAG: hypothetical protein IAF08_10340 [Rhizobacter sp.]|nr:hypothetical protein [Chlorobiales bacterium]
MEMPIQYPYFARLPLSDIEREYVFYHTPRYEFVLGKVKGLLERMAVSRPAGAPPKILDFGPHFLTQILREETGAIVNQLGWRYDSISRLKTGETHIDFDLNRTPFTAVALYRAARHHRRL